MIAIPSLAHQSPNSDMQGIVMKPRIHARQGTVNLISECPDNIKEPSLVAAGIRTQVAWMQLCHQSTTKSRACIACQRFWLL